MDDDGNGRYGLRKRSRSQQSEASDGLERLLTAAETASRIIVFSGSGLSASSGMSTFSTKGGLYERAQRKFKLADGKMLFTYTFYDKNRLEAQSFFSDIYLEALKARPAPGHRALGRIMEIGRLRRHYTLNIDGLAEKVGMDTWHPEENPDGCTVEMHGNVHFMVCTECGTAVPLDHSTAQQLKDCQHVPCATCRGEAEEPNNLRFKVMMYEDAESEVITPEEVMDLMEEDSKAADLIVWVGISFQQSASTAYFRKVRRWLQEVGRLEDVVQAVINPSDEAMWNLLTACSNQQELNVVEVLGSADDILPKLAAHIAKAERKKKSKPEEGK